MRLGTTVEIQSVVWIWSSIKSTPQCNFVQKLCKHTPTVVGIVSSLLYAKIHNDTIAE